MDEGMRNKNHARKTIPSLPLEVIAEILSWLPVLSLMVCKSVCKSWKSIIEEPSFINKNMRRASTILVFGDKVDVDANERKFKIVHSCEGLVLQAGDEYNYRIKNPATKQVLYLPDPVKQPGHMYFHFVRKSKVYKLIHLHLKERGSTDVCCEVLTVVDDTAWRGLDIPSLKNIYGGVANIFFCNNYDLFYTIKIGESQLADSRIIRLDLVTECFTCVKIPCEFLQDWRNVYPIMWDEKICLTTAVGDKLMVRVLENYKINHWADREIVIPLTYVKDVFEAGDKVSAKWICGSILNFNVENHTCIFYDIKARKVKEIRPIFINQNELFELNPSLVQLQGMQPEVDKNQMKRTMNFFPCWT